MTSPVTDAAMSQRVQQVTPASRRFYEEGSPARAR